MLAEDKLFATLDLTTRGIELPDGRNILLTDTVGFISRLPHNLVEAFKSTLEEAAASDIIINVIDISSNDAAEQTRVTKELLKELGCDGIPQINAFNKIDKLPEGENIPEDETTVKISAKNRTGFDRLLKCISENLSSDSTRGEFLIPYSKGSLLNLIRSEGKIFSEKYAENGTVVEAVVDNKIYYMLDEYRVTP